jgi:hypothetical protein
MLGCVALGGCAGSNIADHVPTAIGGLPEDAPKRPAEPAVYPAVHDRPPERGNAIMTAKEQKELEDELLAARDRLTGGSNRAAGGARNP